MWAHPAVELEYMKVVQYCLKPCPECRIPCWEPVTRLGLKPVALLLDLLWRPYYLQQKITHYPSPNVWMKHLVAQVLTVMEIID